MLIHANGSIVYARLNTLRHGHRTLVQLQSHLKMRRRTRACEVETRTKFTVRKLPLAARCVGRAFRRKLRRCDDFPNSLWSRGAAPRLRHDDGFPAHASPALQIPLDRAERPRGGSATNRRRLTQQRTPTARYPPSLAEGLGEGRHRLVSAQRPGRRPYPGPTLFLYSPI